MGIFDFFNSKKKRCKCGKIIDAEDNYCDSCVKEVIKSLKSKIKAKSDLEEEHVERNWKFDISPEDHDCKRLHPNHTHEEWQKIPDVSINPFKEEKSEKEILEECFRKFNENIAKNKTNNQDLIIKIKSFPWGLQPWYINNLISSLRSIDRRVFPSG